MVELNPRLRICRLALGRFGSDRYALLPPSRMNRKRRLTHGIRMVIQRLCEYIAVGDDGCQ